MPLTDLTSPDSIRIDRARASAMTAIILAAGRGTRLGQVTAGRPKCLLPVDGQPVLAHALCRARATGISRAVVVAGFEAGQVHRYLADHRIAGLAARVVDNRRFAETNNIYSLALALEEIDGPITIINGDDLFNLQILRALLKGGADAAAAVDFSRPLPSDAMRTVVESGRVVEIGKDVPRERATGNAIGLYRFSGRAAVELRAEVRRWVQSGRTNAFYVAAIGALLGRLALQAVPTRGLTWGEIDDAHDLAAAPVKFQSILAEERRVTVRAGRIRAALRPFARPAAGSRPAPAAALPY